MQLPSNQIDHSLGLCLVGQRNRVWSGWLYYRVLTVEAKLITFNRGMSRGEMAQHYLPLILTPNGMLLACIATI